MKGILNQRGGGTLLGLAFEGHRLRAAALRRSNGRIEVLKTAWVPLSLDLLTNDPQLVGREIRQQLDAAGFRERRCAVCLPPDWLLTLSVRLPDLSEDDLRSFLELEAERGFPFGTESMVLAESRFRTPEGEVWATLVAVTRDHVARLEEVLAAAQLRPVTFSSGLAALPRMAESPDEGTMTLLPDDGGLGVLVTYGGGMAVLRRVEGVYETESGGPALRPDVLTRELRITLGQLPTSVRAGLRRVRVFGGDEAVEELFEEMQLKAASWKLSVEWVRELPVDAFPAVLPSGTPVSTALCLAARQLTASLPGVELLPPKVSRWERLAARYASRKLAWTASAAGALALLTAGSFGVQQVGLWHWGSRWSVMARQVGEIEAMQQQIRLYRPWYDDSVRSLKVLRRLTEAFPEDGRVWARSVEMRGPTSVVCSGTARDREALLQARTRLGAAPEIDDLKTEQMRGEGPVEFTFNFQWTDGGGQ
ncbi:MAG: pilus assembly protein PilM [Verrucomicrobiae bacterium]|nr:pilus assembly protein PilM [Verrucomicrobiae bacterium]